MVIPQPGSEKQKEVLRGDLNSQVGRFQRIPRMNLWINLLTAQNRQGLRYLGSPNYHRSR
jgi:hypothetical protein